MRFAVAGLTVALALALLAVLVRRLVGERRHVPYSRERTAPLAPQRRQSLDATVDRRRNGRCNRSILDSSADCIAVLEPDGRVILVNRPGLALMGVDDVNEVEGQAWTSFWDTGAASARQALNAAAARGEGRFQAIWPSTRGAPKWCDVIVTPIRGDTGRVLMLVAIARDVTDQKLAEDERARLLARERAARFEAEHAAQMNDELMSRLSHELRTPLNAISGWLAVLKLDQTPETLARAIDVIDRNSRRQSHVIDDFLDRRRIVPERPHLSGQRMDVSPVMVPSQFANLLDGIAALVLEDEPDSRDLVQRLLEDVGARVTAAGTAQEAVAKLEQGLVPDIILSDIGMPDADGYDFIRRVRRMNGDVASVPAAALTALARDEDRQRALTAGYQAHLAKPVDPAELVATVASLTGRTGRSGDPSL